MGTVERMSAKRNRNKKKWASQRKSGSAKAGTGRGDQLDRPTSDGPRMPVPDQPTELDQVGVLIVEEQLGLETTGMDGLREMARRLPFEPSVWAVASLAGRVEEALDQPLVQLDIATHYFGAIDLIPRYRELIERDPKASIFGPQPLQTLTRVLVDEAYDAPLSQGMTPVDGRTLMRAIVASNSVIERTTERGVGPTPEEMLAYMVQIGNLSSRPVWMEELVRARQLYTLATEDTTLLASPDCVPLADWTGQIGISAAEQWRLGFGLASVMGAWDGKRNPMIDTAAIDEVVKLAAVGEHAEVALGALSSDRAELKRAFADLGATGGRALWDMRPFNTTPFLRLQDHAGLLLLGRPFALSWLTDGFHYRAMRVAQRQDAAAADSRTDHVQRYTAYVGQVFETYCLKVARDAIGSLATVVGEQPYGKGGGWKTSDIAVLFGSDLVLFEVSGRRVGAEPLLTGDPREVVTELQKLIVKKIDQLGGTVAALLDGEATLPGVDMSTVKRIIPVAVSPARLWQTQQLWAHLDHARDADKCASFSDRRMAKPQVLDAVEYETVLALACDGAHIGDLLARKASGQYRHRDLAVWLKEARPVANYREVRLPWLKPAFESMAREVLPAMGADP
jgi:hypothetical protein